PRGRWPEPCRHGTRGFSGLRGGGGSRINRSRALVAQGIEQRPPEPCAQVRILPRALTSPLIRAYIRASPAAVPTRQSVKSPSAVRLGRANGTPTTAWAGVRQRRRR